MNVSLRIPRGLRDAMLNDLRRRHAFAAERVGFAKAAIGSTGANGLLLLMNAYEPVRDADYLNDRLVGARIGGDALRAARQSVLDSGHSLFHVHMHVGGGKPRPSKTDMAEIPNVVRSFVGAEPRTPHGFLILTIDHALAVIMQPGQQTLTQVQKVSIVGYPTEILL